MDSYFSVETTATGEYKEKGSKFLAYVFPMEKEEELMDRLAGIKALHPKARHYCYAYRLGPEGKMYRMNDDGEPSGTAGKPIHGQMLSHNVSDVLIVVVRYFGGTKLGASGLIQAYKTAANDALTAAGKKEKILTHLVRIYFPLSETGHVFHVLKNLHLETGASAFDEQPRIETSVRRDDCSALLLQLKAHLLKIPVEQAHSMQADDWGAFDIQVI